MQLSMNLPSKLLSFPNKATEIENRALDGCSYQQEGQMLN
jgi:hypothetical protein